MVRARAVETSRGIRALAKARRRALRDSNVRVRVAAAQAEHGDPAAAPILVERLTSDDWPMVRVAAAEALRGAPSSPEVIEALGKALDQPYPKVRLAAIETLGHHRAVDLAPRLREIADAAREKVSLRVAAVEALGRMCDREALDMLTIFARRSADPRSPEASSGLGRAAVLALAAIHPHDIAKRLEPLLRGPRTPAYMKRLVQEALETPGTCSTSGRR